MNKIKINLKSEKKSYEIIIGKNIIKKISFFLKKKKYDKIALITDSNVEKILIKKILPEIKQNKIELIVVPAGEKTKSIKWFEFIQKKLIEKNFSRKSAIIAFGGGMIGDLAGFVASTFMRGIDLIQIPTTLLACVDSSIGGKTAINSKKQKNIIGTFHQPKLVLIDLNYIESLPEKEFKSGLGEIIKYAIIYDKKLFNYLKKNSKKILKRNPTAIKKIILKSIKIKKLIVLKDEKEQNKRKILNFGHTFGHAIEAETKMKIMHGEAVSIGINFESMLAKNLGLLKLKEMQEIKKLIQLFELKTEFNNNEKKLIELMKKDKKNQEKQIVFSLPEKIGKMKKIKGKYGITVKEKEIKKTMKGLK